MDLCAYRLVDLTHVITPETGDRPVHIQRMPAPEAVPGDDQWYIMHRLEMTLNHVGTHIEAPYHVVRDGLDVAQLPLDLLCGPAVLLDLRAVPPGGVVSRDDLAAAAEAAGGIRPGDAVFCRFDYDQVPAHDRRFSASAIADLVNAGMRLMGVDGLGIELPGSDPRAARQYNHHQLLDRGIPLVEQLAHLDQLSRPHFTALVLPIPISGLDSFPVRVVALEPRDRE